jgi:hypothetical protein
MDLRQRYALWRHLERAPFPEGGARASAASLLLANSASLLDPALRPAFASAGVPNRFGLVALSLGDGLGVSRVSSLLGSGGPE